jgi:catechol 2,3-dioxygenase-like lactoylglutathione lyase family enzyme
MEVLSSRVLLSPRDLERSLGFYEETLGLTVYREWGLGRERGVVSFLGGGLLEVSGTSVGPAPQPALCGDPVGCPVMGRLPANAGKVGGLKHC